MGSQSQTTGSRYQTDAAYREKLLAKCKARYARKKLEDPTYLVRLNKRARERDAQRRARDPSVTKNRQARQTAHRRTPLGQMKHIVYGIASRCRKREHVFELDTAWVEAAAKITHCQKSGLKLRWGHDRTSNAGHVDPLGPSVDRINPSKGYTKKNVRVVAYFVNSAKMSMSEKDFDRVMRAWSKKYA